MKAWKVYQITSFAALVLPAFYVIGLLAGWKTQQPTKALIIVSALLLVSLITQIQAVRKVQEL